MKELICIVCPNGCRLQVDDEHGCAVTGNRCERGEVYGRTELTAPTRVVTSTVRCVGAAHPRCPVKTDRPIPKELVFAAMEALEGVELTAPIHMGDVVIENVCNTGANFITTYFFLKEKVGKKNFSSADKSAKSGDPTRERGRSEI